MKIPEGEGWIKVKDSLPEEGQEVFYYFEYTGTHKGKYTKKALPEEVTGENGFFVNCFYGEDGWLCDDVTHWRPV